MESNRKIRILFFEPYPMGLGGNFTTQLLLLKGLNRNRFTSIVLSPIEGIALCEYRRIGIECFVMLPEGQLSLYGGILLKTSAINRIKTAYNLLKYNISLSLFFRRQKIDLVYANCVRAEMSIGLAAMLAGIPSLLYIKGELNNPIIDRISFAFAKKILFFCEENKNDKYPGLVRFYKNKIGILRIGLDLSRLQVVENRDKTMVSKELEIDRGFINVIVLAQLYPPKGQHLVLEALERLIDDFPNIRLYFLGDHVIEEYKSYQVGLEKFVRDKGLVQNVVFTGWRRDALDVVSLMDIMIHPSLSEGFGRAVLESMALGKPVIASNVGGLREAIKNGENGFLVTPGDVDEIEHRWRQLLLDPQLRDKLGKAAKQTVYSTYLIDDKIESLSKILIKMVDNK